MIAANEQVAKRLSERKVAGALPRPRAARTGGGRAPGRAARVARGADAAVGRPGISANAGRDRGRRDRRWSTSTCGETGHGRRALTSLVLRALKQAHYSTAQPRPRRARADPLLPLHVADPPLPRSGLPPRAAEHGRAAGRRRRRRRRSRRPARGRRRASARRWRSSATPTTSRVASCSSASSSTAAAERSSTARSSALIGAGAFVAFGDGYEGLVPVRRLRGDWWELNEEGTLLVASVQAARSAWANQCGSRSVRRSAARARRPRPRRRPGLAVSERGRFATAGVRASVSGPTTRGSSL